MKRIRWTSAAAADLTEISDYLQIHHPRHRDSTIRKLYATIRSLRDFPYRGRPGRESGTRELVLAPLPYIAIYRVNNSAIEILRVRHGAQER